MSNYTRVCPAADLAPATARLAKIGSQDIAVLRLTDGSLHAIEDACLHAGGPLHEGTLDGAIVTCPWHGWKFDVRDGSCSLNPCVKLACYGVRERDGFIEVRGPPAPAS